MSNIRIWGISGKAGSGKDYIYRTYFKPRRFKNISLAWHFKIGAVGKGIATYEEVFLTKPPHVRKYLQEEGTERGRMVYGENLWTDTAKAWIKLWNEEWGITDFIVPDVRFINEVNFIKEMGGVVFRIDAPNRSANSPLTPEQRLHKSETELDDYTGFDYVIKNDYGDDPYGQLSLIFADRGM